MGGEDTWEVVPEAIVVLDVNTGDIKRGNSRFGRCIVKVVDSTIPMKFVENFIGRENKSRFNIAIKRAVEVAGKAVKDDSRNNAEAEVGSDMDDWLATSVVRDCETLAVGSKKGYPVWRRYDWMLTMLPGTNEILVSGRMTTVVSEEKKASELELIDSLNKAPIAMHWLSGTGHVLWANETELNVLGYTAEEYIGQPIMNFCPDEQELVLEIFKTLGSGNAIADVPVRFRTKSGEIRDLLIDSNVNWNSDGSFKHTRCFIRDDTQRKIREARLEEMSRRDAVIAEAKDNFVRKTFHEIRTPCHLLKNLLANIDEADTEKERAMLMFDVKNQILRLNRLVDDSVDASLFESGKVPVLDNESFCIVELLNSTVMSVMNMSPAKPGVDRYISYGSEKPVPWGRGFKVQDGPCTWFTGDAKKLGRVVEHLLDNALKFTMAGRVEVSLNILEGLDDEDPLIVINVLDTGVGMTQEQVQNSFSKYWQDVTVLNRYIEKEIGVKIRMDSIRSQSLDGFDSPTTMSRVSSLAAAPLVNIGNPDERPGSKGSESFERLFEKSFDIESKDTFKEVQGLGVGLNVINNIIQCMGGTVDFTTIPGETVFCISLALPQSQPNSGNVGFQGMRKIKMNKGASFIFESGSNNPSGWQNVTDSVEANKYVLRHQDDDKQLPAPPPVGLKAMSKSSPHILIVDDNLICQKVARSLVQKLGCTCDLASHGLEAVEMVQKNRNLYDIVFMDLRMPLCDGMKATKMIREDLGLTTLPIVAFTAEVGHEVREQCMMDGFDGFISKPAGKAAVYGEIERLVINKRDECAISII